MSAPDTDFLKANFGLLEKYHPGLWQRFRENPPQPTGEIIFSPQGTPNLRVRNMDGEAVTLHQEHDPTAEIPQFLALVPPEATGLVAFLGMGLGYAPLALLKERPSVNRMVIFELDEGVFWQALRVMDLASLLKNPRVTLLVGKNPDIAKNLGDFMAVLATESIYILEHFAAFGLDRDSYTKLKDDFYQFANAMNIGGSTVAAYGKTFVANRFRQLTGIGHDYFLDSLKGAFAGVPAILVAGGPSLNKNIHLLARAKDKAVIIAVDAVVPPLLNRGIKPDFVGSIDMQSITYEKYGDYAHALSDVSLVCAPWVTPKVPKYVQAERVFWLFSQNDMERWLNSLLGGRLTFPGAGTVAQLNFYAAVLLGCSPIIFVGQDFAFSDDQSHAENIVLSSQQKVQKLLAEKKELHHVPGTLGGTVATDRAFLGMKQTFEETIRNNPNTYINATEGGAHIEGTRVMPLHEVLAEFCQPGSATVATQIAEKLGQATQPNMSILVKEFQATLESGQALLKQIDRAENLSARILGEVKKLERRPSLFSCFKRLPQGLQKQLAQNDAINGKIDQATPWRLLQDVTTEGLRDTERMKVVIEQLEGDPGQYLLWIRKSMERLQEINKVRRQVLDDFLDKISKTIENIEAEQDLLQQDSPQVVERSLALARLYMANGDIRLARATLEPLLAVDHSAPAAAEVHCLLGKIALLQVDFAAADQFFTEAQRLDSSIAPEISAFRAECAEEYLALSQPGVANGQQSTTAKKMLLKGLRFDPGHKPLQLQISAAVTRDMAEATDSPSDADLIKFWHENLRTHPHLATVLNPKQMATIRFAQGQLLFEQQRFTEALDEFGQAAELSPDDPRVHVAIFEAAFNCQDFNRAVSALGLAVALDRSLAGHWEELGDLLLSRQQPVDALAAYEQCFSVQPEWIQLLKKMGDCYLAMDQLEAAREAYRIYQQKVLAGRIIPAEYSPEGSPV
jgi:Tfp pilus assembly protein PilF